MKKEKIIFIFHFTFFVLSLGYDYSRYYLYHISDYLSNFR